MSESKVKLSDKIAIVGVLVAIIAVIVQVYSEEIKTITLGENNEKTEQLGSDKNIENLEEGDEKKNNDERPKEIIKKENPPKKKSQVSIDEIGAQPQSKAIIDPSREVPDYSGLWYAKGAGILYLEQSENKIYGIADGDLNSDGWRMIEGGRYDGTVKKDGSVTLKANWGSGAYSESESKINSNGNVVTGSWSSYSSKRMVNKTGGGNYEMIKLTSSNHVSKKQNDYIDISGKWSSDQWFDYVLEQNGNVLNGTAKDSQGKKIGTITGEITKDRKVFLNSTFSNGNFSVENMQVSNDGKILFGSNKVSWKRNVLYYIRRKK